MPEESLTAEQLLARSIRLHRERLRLTAKQLAERITELGGTLSRQAISKIELGERDVRINELMLLARALKTSPLLLLFPVGTRSDQIGEHVELAGEVMDMWTAIRWFSGEAYPPEDVDVHWGVPLFLWRQHEKLRDERAFLAVYSGNHPTDPNTPEELAQLDSLWGQIKNVRADMRRHGLTPPPAVGDIEGIDDGPRRFMNPEEVEAHLAAGHSVNLVDHSKPGGRGVAMKPGDAERLRNAIEHGRRFAAEFDARQGGES